MDNSCTCYIVDSISFARLFNGGKITLSNLWLQVNQIMNSYEYGYSPRKSGEFQPGDAGEVPWCPCNGRTQGHQHTLQWFCHPFHPAMQF